jgi:uncharacterized UPF0146 family protein
MYTRKLAQRGSKPERYMRKRRPDKTSYEQRTLVRTISDDIALESIAHYFRTQTIGLIRQQDQVLKSWLDITDKGDIVVGYQLLGPPLKKEVKVKLTVYNGS